MLHHDAGFEIKETSPTGRFTGYGSVYDVADEGDDVVAAGTFTESLKEWSTKGALPAMLWQHKSSEPVGSYTRMSEDSRGLAIEGQLMMKTQLGQYAFECLRTKAVTGLSIGFVCRDDSYDQKTGVRTIKKADLWEVSIVTFPMNDKARIDSIKAIEQVESRSDVEKFLREVGVSRSEAKAMTSRLWTLARREVAQVYPDGSQAVLDALKRYTATLASPN